MVSVPEVSVNEISSVTITDPPMIISSEPVGSTPLVQLFRSDHTPVGPPTQTPFTIGAAVGIKETVSISALRPSSGPSSWNPKTVELDDAVTRTSKCAQSVVSPSLVLALNVPMIAPSQWCHHQQLCYWYHHIIKYRPRHRHPKLRYH